VDRNNPKEKKALKKRTLALCFWKTKLSLTMGTTTRADRPLRAQEVQLQMQDLPAPSGWKPEDHPGLVFSFK